MIKLPKHYYNSQCYWAHMVTLRCNSGCPYCILNGRGRYIKQEELSGKEILNWWNNVEHSPKQKLSLIGGEPTLHPDIVEIVNNLKNYNITITTNCKSPFYNDKKFNKKFKVHKSSTLRINTTYHPHHLTADEYIEVITKWRETPYFVDQTSFVYTPKIMKKYGKDIKKVQKHIKMQYAPYLGFYTQKDEFKAEFKPSNLNPDENYHDQHGVRVMCGLSNLNSYREMSGQMDPLQCNCGHPRRSLIIGPNGNYYHCHYKLYYDIDPVGNIKDEKFNTIKNELISCRHFGKCNPCDYPRLSR